MKKILIIGVSGFIGRELYHSLGREYQVSGIARTKIDLVNCDVVDVSNRNDLMTYFSNHNFDIVINLAAILASAENLRDIGVLTDNLQITSNLIDALKTKEGAHFLNFSSSSVYSNLTGKYTEQGVIKPSDNSDCLYGLSKFNSEMLFDYLLKNHAVDVTQLRVPMVYGVRMNSERIHKVFEKELLENNSISVWGNGERVISHIHIDELSNKLKNIIGKRLCGTFNLMGESISMFDLAQRIINEQGDSKSTIERIDKGSKAQFVLDGILLNNLLDD
jgi:nucleoside-diphosphate-sugar epimerase